MATRQTTRIKDETVDRQVAALLPVNRNGDVVGDAQPWQMPAGDDIDSLSPIPDEIEIEETPIDRVLGLLRDSGSDATVKIDMYRLPGNGRKLTWVDTLSPEDFERGGLKFLSEKWGAGDYELRVYGTTNGRTGIKARIQVSLEAPRATPVLGSAQNSELARALETMAVQQAEMLKALTQRPEPVNAMAQMTEMLTLMKLMKEATEAPVPQKSSIGEMVDAIKELKGVSSLINPESESDSLMSSLKDLLPLIQAGLAQRNQAQQIPQLTPLPQIAMQPDPLPTISGLPTNADIAAANAQTSDAYFASQQSLSATSKEVNEMDAIGLIKLQGNLAVLLAMAKGNVPPDAGAEYVYEELPDEMIDLLSQESWWTMLSTMESKVTPYQTWFTSVRDKSLALFETEEENAQDAGKSVDTVAAAPESDAANPS